MADPLGLQEREYDVDHKLVNDMANHMFEKLRRNAHKAHWQTVTNQWLFDRLKQEVAELENALADGIDIVHECADVANFAAMIADNVTNKKG